MNDFKPYQSSQPQIIQNAVYIPEENKYIISGSAHDFVSITLKDGKIYFIDGGRSYFRAGGDIRELYNTNRVVKMHLTVDDSFTEKMVPNLLWGTRGLRGDKPLKYLPMISFESDHLQAILDNCPNASQYHKLVAHHLLYIRRIRHEKMVA